MKFTRQQLKQIIKEELNELFDADDTDDPSALADADALLRSALDDYVEVASASGANVEGGLDKLSDTVSDWIETERTLAIRFEGKSKK
jgi:hypothetical protein